MTLLQMTISGAVLILAVLLIRALTVTRLPKQTFLILWGLVLFRLLVPFTISSPFSVYTLLCRNMPAAMLRQMPSGILIKEIADEAFPAASAPERSGKTASTWTPSQSAESFSSQIPEQATKNDTVSSAESSASADIKTSGTQNADGSTPSFNHADRSVPLSTVLFFLYCTGVLLCAAFFLFSYLRCQLEFRTALPVSDPDARQWLKQWLDAHPMRRSLSIRQSDRVDTPLTYGILRPVILLPKKISWENTASLHCILTHEIVHIRRLDAVTKLLIALALCLHWFNPLVWVMYLLFNKDLELACDEQVIYQLGETGKAAYAHMLLDLEARKSGLVPLYNHFGKTAIEERITAIMKTKRYSRPVILFATGLIIGMAAFFATSAAYTSAAEPTGSSLEPAQTPAASVQKNLSMPDPDFTKEEYDILFSLQFDGYLDMSVSEYQQKAWTYVDTPERLALLERFSQSKILEDLRFENETASFLHNLYNALTGDRWRTREFSNYTVSSPVDGSGDTATLEYTATLRINRPDSLTLREYDAARSGMMEGLHSILDDVAVRSLTNEAYMDHILSEKINVLQSAFCSDALEITVDYVYMPPDLHDGETDRLMAQRNIEQELVQETVAKLEQQTKQYHQTALAQQRFLAIQEELSLLMEDEILHAQANREHTRQLEKVLRPYAPFGLSWAYDPVHDDYKIYFEGKEVRGIQDTQAEIYITEHSGISTYAKDAIELFTVYENGTLTGLRLADEQEMQEMTALRKKATDSLYSDREPRINDCATAEDYRSLFTLMTPDYASHSLTQFNGSLLDWANTYFDSYERIQEDCYRKEAFQEEPLIDLTEEQSRFIALTMMLSCEENRCQIQHLKTGRPEEDPVFYSYHLSKEAADGLLWCGFDYAFRYHISEKDKVSVGRRDRLIGNVVAAIQDFWIKTDLETLQDMTREDVLDKLESIAARYSNDQITIAILEDQLYFEHMDERAYTLP